MHIDPKEWEIAIAYFKSKPDAIKMHRVKKHTLGKIRHSFIKIDDEIYAIANGKYLGKGGFGRVKIAQNYSHEKFAVKIEELHINPVIKALQQASQNAEIDILQEIRYLKGRIKIDLGVVKFRRDRVIDQKHYTLIELHLGKDLKVILESKNLSEQVRLVIAAKCCLEIKKLHSQFRILHCDIKLSNFVCNKEGDHIVVRAIDFGFAVKMLQEQNFVKGEGYKGTRQYMAPEVLKGIFYFASDIYALGVMFELMQISSTIHKDMKNHDPEARPSLQEIIDRILNYLLEKKELEQTTIAFIHELKSSEPKLQLARELWGDQKEDDELCNNERDPQLSHYQANSDVPKICIRKMNENELSVDPVCNYFNYLRLQKGDEEPQKSIVENLSSEKVGERNFQSINFLADHDCITTKMRW